MGLPKVRIEVHLNVRFKLALIGIGVFTGAMAFAYSTNVPERAALVVVASVFLGWCLRSIPASRLSESHDEWKYKAHRRGHAVETLEREKERLRRQVQDLGHVPVVDEYSDSVACDDRCGDPDTWI